MWNAVETGDTGVAFSKPKTLRVVEWIKGEELETTNVHFFLVVLQQMKSENYRLRGQLDLKEDFGFLKKGKNWVFSWKKGK